ncbi:MAG: hypothetical protein MMC23_002433 [Stictis urceolatum]|nr:hypothetical protein [Stictis urceolata]
MRTHWDFPDPGLKFHQRFLGGSGVYHKNGIYKILHTANLALAFSRKGLRSGILDTDIFGPSIPTLFNLSGEPRLSSDNRLIPLINYGVKTMSMGYLVAPTSAVVWRGLMVQKALQQLLHETSWGGLDVLILDLPPGTGDVQLTIAQQIHLDGSIIISTPQDLALQDAVKGIEMFRKTDIRVLGMVQNMSVFVCPSCGEKTSVFGQEGVRRRCEDMGVELLADVPLDARVCEDADRGRPTVVSEPEGERARVFLELVGRVGEMVGVEGMG